MSKLKKILAKALYKIFKKKSIFFYNSKENSKFNFNNNCIYCPHPFTNWSLNPYYSRKGIKQHTIEGFRKTDVYNSVESFFKNGDKDLFKIFCVGGSTTYCTEIDSYEDTWPFMLNLKLSKINKNCVVANAGVGGWGTIQSLNRFQTWGSILKPNLTIIYQSKNDLTPFFNGRLSEKKIFPDLQNIMLQYSQVIPKNNFASKFFGLHNLYGDLKSLHDSNLDRFLERDIQLTRIRYQLFSYIASFWGGKVLYIPELIKKDSTYFKKMALLHNLMEGIAADNENSHFFDMREFYPLESKLFLDKIHFNKQGCELFSEILLNQIIKNHI